MMKILFLAPANSIHTQKWVTSFASENEVFLITQHPSNEEYCPNTIVLPVKNSIGYYLNAPFLNRLVSQIKPDVINVHYASGYGTLARLAKIPPYLLNVWGSDVYDFPYQSHFNMLIIKRNLKKAYRIASTSKVMKQQTLRLMKHPKEITVTPFGINTDLFTPLSEKKEKRKFIVGTVKTLDPKYGITTLIKAFNYAYEKGMQNAGLVIVGTGPQEEELKELANSLDCSEKITFVGKVPNSEVPKWLNSFDVYCALSMKESESFGVAVVEAESCGLPVIVSNIGGLPEVIENNVTGYLVEPGNYQETGEYIIRLFNNSELREKMGKQARQLAKDRYDWKQCVDIMEKLYITTRKEMEENYN